MSDYEKFNKRLTDLEDKFKGTSVKAESVKKPRKPSEYNIFMKDYFAKNSKDSKKTHRELFTEAAKAWSAKNKN
jgi:hypothetical protein